MASEPPSSSWSLLAAEGSTGGTGAEGATGLAGATGAIGPTGSNGLAGLSGATGAAGVTGATGPTGAAGATGATGTAGVAGSDGKTGATGSTGAAGATGSTGATGVGVAGATGATGAAGSTGATGVGIAGATGATGTTGATGATGVGVAGATGATGATGLGVVGPTGATGGVGPTGAQGPAELIWTGTWSAAAQYVVGDAVLSAGSAYIAIASNINNAPPSSVWNLLASEGAIGPTGALGPTGATGLLGPNGNTGALGPTGPVGPTGGVGVTTAVSPLQLSGTTLSLGTVPAANLPADICYVDQSNNFTVPQIFTSISASGSIGASGPITTSGAVTAASLTTSGNITSSGTITGTFSGNGSGLTGVASASSTGFYAASSPPENCTAGNAGQVYYNTGSNTFLGCNGTAWSVIGADVAGTSVPGSVSWPSNQTLTGNAVCAVAAGVCQSATDLNGNSILCSAPTAGGNATCAAAPNISVSASWDGVTSSGDYSCLGQTAYCVQAYDASGNPLACSTTTTSGRAACNQATAAAQGWDTFATWSGITSTGYAACIGQTANCVQAYDGSGNAQSCTNEMTSGRARCLHAQPGDAWNTTATWGETPSSGFIQCGALNATCVSQVYTGPTYSVTTCATVNYGAGYAVYATCKSNPAGYFTTTWSSVGTTGNVACAKLSGVCLSQGYVGPDGSGQITDCNTDNDANGYTILAQCRPVVPATDGWDSVATWESNQTSGNFECAKINADCVKQMYSGTGSSATSTCSTLNYAAGYTILAECKLASTATVGWDTHVVWSGFNQTGTAACASIGSTTCSSTVNYDGSIHPCSDSIGDTGEGAVAKCNK